MAQSLADHPDFPEMFRVSREQVWGEFAPRYERAVTAGNAGAAERIQTRIDELARQRAVVALRSMTDFEAGRGPFRRQRARPTGIDYTQTPGRASPLSVLTGVPRGELTNPTMTAEEIETHSGVIQRLLGMFGATREAALAWERQRRERTNKPMARQSDGMSDEMLDAYFRELVRVPYTTTETGEQVVTPTPPARNWPDRITTPGRGPPTLTGWEGPDLAGTIMEGSPVDFGERMLTPGGRPPPVPPNLTPSAQPPRSTVFREEEMTPAVTNALLPTAGQREEMQAEFEGLGNLGTIAALAPAPRALQLAGQAAGRGAQIVGNALARVPRTTAATAAGALTVAGAAETQEQPPANPQLDEARGNAQTASGDLANAEERLRTLGTEAARFSPQSVNRNDPEAIKEAQRILQGAGLYLRDARGRPLSIDGRWGPGMSEAIATYLERNREDQVDLRGRLTNMRVDARKANERVLNLERSANARTAEANLPWWRKTLRDWAEPLTVAGGAVLGSTLRTGRNVLANRVARTEATRADALINPAAPLTERVSNISEFYRRGGGRAPFDIDRATPHGIAPAAGQTLAGDLYRPPGWWGQRVNTTDVAGAAIPTAIAARGELLILPEIRKELAEAREAFEQNGSEENATRLARAQSAYTTAMIQTRVMEGMVPSYLGAGFIRPRVNLQPHLGRAGQEVLDINRALQQPLEVWSSPKGRNRLFRYTPNGPYFDERGVRVPAPPQSRRDWRRTSQVEIDFFGGYPGRSVG